VNPFRNVKILSEYSRDVFTIEQFVDEIYINKDIQKYFSEEKYLDFRRYLVDKSENICVRFGLNPSSLTKNDFCKIHNEYRKSAVTQMTNLMNYYGYSVNLLSIPSIESIVKNVPVEEKNNSKLLLKVVKKLSSDLLSVPIFSNGNKYFLCGKTYRLK